MSTTASASSTQSGSKCDLLVIGAGLSRTGTLSTRSALEHLLGGICYHGAVPLAERPEHVLPWLEVFNSGKLEAEVADMLLEGYIAGLDVTFFTWYKELMKFHPKAKVLLTVRDPHRWFASMSVIHNIARTLSESKLYAGLLTAMGLGHIVKFMRTHESSMPGILGRVNKAMMMGEEEAVAVFNSHVDEVISVVPPERLLVFDVRDGWEPLCTFLNRPIPDIPFPCVNDTATMLFTFNTIRLVCWLVVLAVPISLAIFLPMCETASGRFLAISSVLAFVFLGGCVLQAVVKSHAGRKN